MPLLKWIRILGSKSNKQFANIISDHISAIKDRLFNVIELAESSTVEKNDLILASIEQKSQELEKYDFLDAIDYKRLKRRSFFLLFVVIVFTIYAALFSNDFNEASKRLVHFNTFYERPAPFTFQLLNESLTVKRGESIKLQVSCEGRRVPELLYVNISGTNYLMNANSGVFEYELDHINNSFPIYFTDTNFRSKKYRIDVLPSPMILEFSVEVDAPEYTGLGAEEISNVGDLEIASGSTVNWKFKTVDTDTIKFVIDNQSINLVDNQYYRKIFKNQQYFISLENQYFQYDSLLQFNIAVIPDEFPNIELVQLRDSLNYSRFYFKGSIQDDYGFNQLSFNLIINEKDSLIDIPIIKNLNEQDFYYMFDFADFSGVIKQIYYYFQVADNDIYNGYKKTSSDAFEFVFPNDEELLEFENKQFAEIDELMEKSHQLSQDIKQSIDELRFKSLGDNASNWEKQQMASEIINKKNQLESVLNQIQEKNKELNQMMNSFSEEKKEVLQKQKEIEQLLNDVLSDELKELFEEFYKLAQDFNSDEFNQLDDKYDMALEDLSEQLERNLQVLKRMKVEQKMERIVDKLSEIAEEEKKIQSQFEESRDFNSVTDKEMENEEKLGNLKKEMDKVEELNNELNKPMNIPSFEKEFNDISDTYKEVKENLENKRKRKASEGIGKNSNQISNLAVAMQQVLEQNKNKQQLENLANLRQLLDNLVFLSLEQERIFDILRATGVNNPVVNDVHRMQDELYNQSEMVKDSLYALAKRTPSIDNVVNKEILDMQYLMKNSIEELDEDRISYAVKNQQGSITAINNLAVFLSEALENIEKQMANSMPGDQQCDKPGQDGKSGMSMLKQSQESLKEQMQQMIEQMKSGNSSKLNKKLGQTLAQQEIMQQLVRDLLNSNEVGSSSKEQLKQIDQLIEQNKLDLMNKNLTQQTINRQNLILDRLLKAERAEIEREVDDQRKSTTAEEQFFSNPAEFFEYKRKESEFKEQIDRSNYKLKKFYLQKYKNYINQLNK
ncbi:hypothetical protein ACUNWD_04250 [Sunxiuqinia sp. A32]|uniref:hypothetical protein n=1 Tax=Sunxiuqinia sp. A32 TaxID=3461496 RepID=UPI0040467516